MKMKRGKSTKYLVQLVFYSTPLYNRPSKKASFVKKIFRSEKLSMLSQADTLNRSPAI